VSSARLHKVRDIQQAALLALAAVEEEEGYSCPLYDLWFLVVGCTIYLACKVRRKDSTLVEENLDLLISQI
jgi:hypothetical protein